MGEKDLPPNQAIFHFVRHGKSPYERKGIDLTQEGIVQIQEAAFQIANEIDPEKESVVLWSSPAHRAVASRKLIKAALSSRKIRVMEEKEIDDLHEFGKWDLKALDQKVAEVEARGMSFDVFFARDAFFEKTRPEFESRFEVRRRTDRVLDRIKRLVQSASRDKKKIHIIAVGHFEAINPLVEEIFGLDVERGEGVKNGEYLRLDLSESLRQGQVNIDAEFRGQQRKGVDLI